MHRIAGWWDGFELWVAGLPFIPQFLVVLVGMVPISFAIAYGLDRVLRAVLRVLDRRYAADIVPVRPAPIAAAAMPEPEQVAADDRRPVQSGAR
ncbi:hypothetical protein IU459_28315 [Nocardia amamiensis]|uniref:Uncharacterized protein n=1 Tax=Nocardia amamiensis TaxID=404578 RepID=A0ABS0CZY5_9NOCA|nr:hypothetical protein [Nocardia amamiensis]MBF6301413.1 hypothetical protein [Nocardia amamiensis]